MFATPSRFDENTMRLPSGDHTGLISFAGSKVNRDGVLRARSINQISADTVCGSTRLTATRFSSGESRGPLSIDDRADGPPTNANCFPARSNQVSCVLGELALKKTSTPVCEAEKAPRPVTRL